jgi:uncharacterized protein (TIGR03086 family)
LPWLDRSNAQVGALHLQLDAVAGKAVDHSQADPDTPACANRIGTDPAAAFDAVATRAMATWRTPGIMQRTATLPIGTVPVTVVSRMHLVEVVVHGWDIGEGTPIPIELTEPVLDFCREFVAEELRGTAFGERITVHGAETSAPRRSPILQPRASVHFGRNQAGRLAWTARW